MLLNEEEWSKIAKKPGNLKSNNFILTYFLDSINEKKKQEIANLACTNNLEVINLANIYTYADLDSYVYGPSEFIYLIKNAKLVLTDSFHACVFSIIFNTTFYVFDREGDMLSMYYRLETLLGMLKLTKHKVNAISEISDVFKCDYKKAQEILKLKKEKSFNFIKNALNK